MKPKIKLTCVFCGKEFESKNNNSKQKTCSLSCKYGQFSLDRTKEKEVVLCSVCGKEIHLPPSIAKTRKTCSYECDSERRRRRSERKCLVCGAVFITKPGSKQKMCSEVCGKVWVSDVVPRMKGIKCEAKICEVCGVSYIRKNGNPNQRFCGETCKFKAQSLGLVVSHSYGHYGYRQDLGRTFRSSFEANFARVMNHLGFKWEYEPRCFSTSLGFYTPDFFVAEYGGFVELRGVRCRSTDKAMLASKEHSFSLKMIYQDDFEKEFGHLSKEIKNWESVRNPVFDKIDPSIYENRTCKCGNVFLSRRSRKSKGLYCSKKCSSRYKWDAPHGYNKRILSVKKCESCGTEFETKTMKRFCNHSCYADSLRRNHEKHT